MRDIGLALTVNSQCHSEHLSYLLVYSQINNFVNYIRLPYVRPGSRPSGYPLSWFNQCQPAAVQVVVLCPSVPHPLKIKVI
jgi:hypothetical protein